jgi:hypothetical protein
VIDFASSQLSAWQSFYVIVGSSGGALIGVQFVVITLIAGMRRRTTADEVGAFGTPTVVHFAGALLVSAIMSAPWASLFPPSVALAASGLAGFVYGGVVIHRARRQTGYRPVWQDWLWYASLPCGTYGALALAALVLRTRTQLALAVIAAAALGLLLIGIHNAWDSVQHVVVVVGSSDDAPKTD